MKPQSPLRQAFNDGEELLPKQDGLRRKKSFFDRFERKIRVDDVLDMYMTPEQLDHEKALKLRNSKPMKQVLMRMWSTTDRGPDRADAQEES